MPRLTPFDLVFSQLADDRFPRVRAALETAGRDAGDRDAFLIERETVILLHELRPDEGLGEGIDRLAALLHHAYLFWEAGGHVVVVGDDALEGLLAEPPAVTDPVELPRSIYLAFPERRVWAELMEGEAPEPLEGCFLHAPSPDRLSVLGVFGMRPERMGFSVVEAEGARPVALARPDGTPLFAPTLAGGAAAGVHSLTGAEELLELGWRARALAAPTSAGAGRWTR